MRYGTRFRNGSAASGRRRLPTRSITLVAGVAALVAAVSTVRDTPDDTPYRELAGPGHGRGLSQHGAFDSAQRGETAEQILAHYYPGATLGAVGPTTIAVRLTDQDDAGLDVFAETGLRVAGREVGRGQAVHLTALPDGGANVVVTAGCDGDVQWQGSTRDPWVYPLDPNPGRPAAEHLTLCGGSAYRGALGLASEDGAARTVNRVNIEDYLLGLVPAEVQANWADKGAREALRAQAVAARSYALAEQRYPYAQTCDTTDCQVYPGTAAEDPRAAEAVASTAGTVLLREGRILRAEYSAAPDGGAPADIQTFDVGPTPAELGVGKVPTDPRVDAGVGPSGATPPAVPDGAVPGVETAIAAEYHRIGGASSTVGVPLGPEMRLPEEAGTYRLFTNGVIIATPSLGAQVVDFTTLMQMVPDANPPAPSSPDRNAEAETAAGPETGTAPRATDSSGAESGDFAPDGIDPGAAGPDPEDTGGPAPEDTAPQEDSGSESE